MYDDESRMFPRPELLVDKVGHLGLLQDSLRQSHRTYLVAAEALGVGKVNGYILFNHTRCTAGPHDFPGFTFLGTAPCWANPEMEEDAD
jgi:hypothetical protein